MPARSFQAILSELGLALDEAVNYEAPVPDPPACDPEPDPVPDSPPAPAPILPKSVLTINNQIDWQSGRPGNVMAGGDFLKQDSQTSSKDRLTITSNQILTDAEPRRVIWNDPEGFVGLVAAFDDTYRGMSNQMFDDYNPHGLVWDGTRVNVEGPYIWNGPIDWSMLAVARFGSDVMAQDRRGLWNIHYPHNQSPGMSSWFSNYLVNGNLRFVLRRANRSNPISNNDQEEVFSRDVPFKREWIGKFITFAYSGRMSPNPDDDPHFKIDLLVGDERIRVADVATPYGVEYTNGGLCYPVLETYNWHAWGNDYDPNFKVRQLDIAEFSVWDREVPSEDLIAYGKLLS